MRTAAALLILVALVPRPCRADEPQNHWAWKKPERPKVPVADGQQPANPVDAFIRAKLTAAKLSLAPPATREQLIRRVTFDLHGLPPTPEEIDAFVSDKAPEAWAKVVDRLLASPRYGERWGRHWLDLARYADTNGYEFDEPRPDAWRYRDYVIKSFNDDKPFDRFITEQLAGDEAFPNSPEALVATGFNLLGPDMTDSADQAQRRLNTLTDMTDTAALAFLGLTVTCARCHDHKFEPISQKDYFRLQAFFTPANFRKDIPVVTPTEVAARISAVRSYEQSTKGLREQLAAVEEPHRKKMFEDRLAKLSPDAQTAHRTAPAHRTGGQIELVAETEAKVRVTDAEGAKALTPAEKARTEELKAKLKAFDSKKPPAPPVAMGLTDKPGVPPKTFLLERGELDKKGVEVEPGFPVVLLPESKEAPATVKALANSTGRRLALANWVASTDNPLTARVIVNRLWQHHFGRGIIGTASDFGLRGQKPTHPELLDWLACELMHPSPTPPLNGEGLKITGPAPWALKRLHRLMLLSETYQQSTQASKDGAVLDPDNKLLAHANRLRLEGEAVRDSLLAVGGRLNPKMGGPGVVLPEASRAAGGSRAVAVTTDAAEHTRRSVYLLSRRNLKLAFLEAFDLPDSNLSCPKRERSTTATQALALLNAEETMVAAKALAYRLTREAKDEDARIALAYRLTLGRVPAAKETERAKAFLKESPLSELCRALFNVNEFVYLD
ncbi:Uncharacterized protein OS=Singulisphaera acidiphila (strain ATCC BAA-1392 / DSM 18658 / VKM B-2454 / MOB10) GN=Sinac_4601 PE=4 SV=1: PSCyt2: PSD1 [Gemmata massiliana]|uniref:DUF1549 domain-containing protein n=1 Tax=Gemmata massiliana TaxID=1210884 RepID=A0A6P2D9M1_9BACT|nr:DUF1549 and DUF1553 domain-containing protein [Gemmata massiliana]VTR96202.1 Uncharacterized protein OS=Singulisphaera acidiphila (strain ATCC BAA-1392 / DSM 18658 / VKM B-2454 / MOB10) GN=Sinac_4601 PE=4 SV=1: PSCyt2: PSD1 [Gemmata massiliana]